MKIVQEKPTSVNRRFSDKFRKLVKKCLIKDPEKRITVSELLEDPFIKDAH